MQKILYIITQKDCGGAQKNVLDLALGMENRYQIKVAAGPDGGNWLFEELEKNKIPAVGLNRLHRAINPINDFLACQEIKQLLRREKPDVLHLHSSKAGLIGSLAAALSGQKIKVIYTSHGAAFAGSHSLLNKKIFLLAEKISARWKHKIICVSNKEKNVWLENRAASPNKLTVIVNGINPSLANFLEKNQAREELLIKIPPTDKLIGCLANFYPDKGLSFLVDAVDLVCRKRTDVRFAIIGDGSERKNLEEKIKNKQLKDKIILTGQIPDASRYLRAFDLYVQPSIKEGFGYTILEALTAELPVVSTDVGGAADMITSGQNGLIVPPQNAPALAEGIITLLESPKLAQKLAENSRQNIQKFSTDTMVKQTEKVYLEI